MAKEKTSNLPVRELATYNIHTLADELGKSPAEVRVMLRKSTVEKPGSTWGWDKKGEFDKVLKELKSMGAAPKTEKAAKPAKADKAESTAKPARAKKSAKAKADA